MIDPEIWADFLVHRKAKRCPLVAGPAKRFYARLAGMWDDYNVDAALLNSMERGWNGCLQPNWDNSQFKRPKTPIREQPEWQRQGYASEQAFKASEHARAMAELDKKLRIVK